MATLTATEARETQPAGVYEATVKEILLQESQDPQYDNPQYLLWVFNARKGKRAGEIAATSSTSFGTKAKARKWAEALLGRKIKAGEVIDTDELAGKHCQIVVQVEKRDDGSERNRVTDLIAEEGDDEADDDKDAAF